MSRPLRQVAAENALPFVFATRSQCAAIFQVSLDTFDQWVRDGFIPPPAFVHKQIQRWHWPTVEAHLIGSACKPELDPYIAGVRNAAIPRR